MVTDESYDTYIYQSDKFTIETTDWLDDQEELIAIRSWSAEEKTDFVDLMLKEYVLNVNIRIYFGYILRNVLFTKLYLWI